MEEHQHMRTASSFVIQTNEGSALQIFWLFLLYKYIRYYIVVLKKA
jgi:hypothetical protein